MEHTGFPSDETLAAFIDGRLDPETRQKVVDHMTGCDECYSVAMGGGEGIDTATTQKAADRGRIHFYGKMGLTAALVAFAIAAAILLLTRDRFGGQKPLLAQLNDVAPPQRLSEARMSGIDYRPVAPRLRGKADNPAEDRRNWKLYGLADRITDEIKRNPSTEGTHALGAAQLLLGRLDEARATLEDALSRETHSTNASQGILLSQDSSLLLDLSAALYARSIDKKDEEDASLALRAANRVLQVSPANPAALFNRALILEKLELREDAVSAWRQYLSRDDTSPWAEEAKKRLKDLLDGDGATNRDFSSPGARREQHRVRISEHLLPEWGDALLHNRLAQAKEKLEEAETLAHSTAADPANVTVRAVDEATRLYVSGDWTRLRLLARAYSFLGRAAAAYHSMEIDHSTKYFRQANANFVAARSDARPIASMGLAECFFYRNDFSQALRYANDTATLLGREDHAALGRALWLSGLCNLALGHPYEAVNIYTRARNEVDKDGDLESVAAVENLLAEAYEYLGEPARASQNRRSALRLAYRAHSQNRLELALSEAASCAVRWGRFDEAEVTTKCLLRVSSADCDPSIRTDALLNLARLCALNRDLPGARSALVSARSEAEEITSLDMRERMLAMVALAAGETGVDIEDISGAVRFYARTHNSFGLTVALAQRARAAVQSDDLATAESSLLRALATVEKEASAGDKPAIVSQLAEGRLDIVDDLVDILCQSGRCVEAFPYVEGVHGGSDRPSDQISHLPRLPAGVVLVDYLVTRHSVYAWTVRDGSVVATTLAVNPDDLRAEAANLTSMGMAFESEEGWSPVLRLLYKQLVAPLAGLLYNSREILVSPDRFLHSIPFAALIDAQGHYLIERVAIGEVPGSTSIRALTSPPKARTKVLLLYSDITPARGLSPSDTLSEVRKISRLYLHADLLSSEGLSPEGVVKQIENADVIHIATHAFANSDQPSLSAIQLSGGSDLDAPVMLYANQIAAARLSRNSVVFLSACSTGASSRQRAGVTNLASAFLTGGAARVIATLWPIQDERAGEMAVETHRKLVEGVSAPDALRSAQLHCIRSGDAGLRTPSFWAAYTVVGSL